MTASPRLITLDGSKGEGGGQILRTALSLSLLTGRAFRIVKVRANRDKPGLRPQHLTAVETAAALGGAEVSGGSVGSRDLTFRPGEYAPRDLRVDIGTAGSTCLVLQTLHLPLALRAEQAVRVTLTGGTFNLSAPSFPFLETTWRAHLAALGAPIALAMPAAGFYPRGGRPARRLDRAGRAAADRAGGSRAPGPHPGGRGGGEPPSRHRREDARPRLGPPGRRGLEAEIATDRWPGIAPGAAIALTAEHAGVAPATFVGLGARGKPAEAVADEAVDELLAYLDAGPSCVDPHSADQILVPLSLAPGRSEYTVSAVTEHLRTNAATIRAFLDRTITIDEPDGDRPGRVVVE